MQTTSLIRRAIATAGAALIATSVLAACTGSDSSGDDETLILYSGRSESLVGPLVERIGGTIPVTAAYDKKAAQILEEGDRSPADLFFAQDAGELGALADAGLLEPLPADIVEAVPDAYRSGTGSWTSTSARSRVLIYDPRQLSSDDLPAGIDGLLTPEMRGKVGYAPTNASFKSFVTALRLTRGEDGAREWLTAFLANDPKSFEGNGPIVEAVNNGQLAAGLTNHYYWVQEVQEKGLENVPGRLHFFSDQDPGALVNVGAIGVLKTAGDKEAAFDFIRQLHTPETQTYFATEVGEYPVIGDEPLPVEGLPTLSQLSPPKITLDELADVSGTDKLLNEVGAV
ncbi:putative iron(III) ABC transporter substrate-binding protein [Gordonia paraffinivorans NBRC 108238]|uniref:Iron(III) ABC transporter substrate-binding protein n=1 Tax=Gordonia paraffinivorans NBRC 108238 TaxID=1223543 RepID=A0ABQ0IRP2_9ACTN|nr:extracellular solute-binding protein [Gordonia paraffinivorans]GAC86180.1 putative iron(III) ABC transporter substrate-binding protein [Gordonia paraffinivorans NBRC 108238]